MALNPASSSSHGIQTKQLVIVANDAPNGPVTLLSRRSRFTIKQMKTCFLNDPPNTTTTVDFLRRCRFKSLIRTGKFKENPAPLKYSSARYGDHSPAQQIVTFQLEGMTYLLSFKKAGVYTLGGKIYLHIPAPSHEWCGKTLRGCKKWHPNSHPFGTPKGGSRYLLFFFIFRYGHQRISIIQRQILVIFWKVPFFKVWFNGPYVQWGSVWWICFCWSVERWSQEEIKFEVIRSPITLTLVVAFDGYTLGWE